MGVQWADWGWERFRKRKRGEWNEQKYEQSFLSGVDSYIIQGIILSVFNFYTNIHRIIYPISA